MWAVVVVLLNALSGPDVHVVREAVYPSEDACKAGVAKNIPAKLETKQKAEFDQGFRRYVCVRIAGAEDLLKAK